MRLILEVTEGSPIVPDGWNIGHLANLGLLISCDGFSARLDLHNLNLLFDAAEDGEAGEIQDHSGSIIEVIPTDDSIILKPRDNPDFPYGLVLDLKALKDMGIEKHEDEENEEEPENSFDLLDSDDIIKSNEGFDLLDDSIEEGVKRAFRRSGRNIRRGFRVTSGFRKGRVVSSVHGAWRPRAKASTRMKLSIASKRKKFTRVLKGKRTRKKPASRRLVRMNKRNR